MSEELWKGVIGFPNYEVSNLGNIRNKEGRILKPTLDTYGYRQICLYRKDGLGWRGHGRYTRKIYRLVIEAFTEPEPERTQIDHINRIRSDDRLENLRWVTCRENSMNRGIPTDLTGINWNKKNSTFMIRVYAGVGKKQKYLACCKDLEEAKKIRDNYYLSKRNEDNQC